MVGATPATRQGRASCPLILVSRVIRWSFFFYKVRSFPGIKVGTPCVCPSCHLLLPWRCSPPLHPDPFVGRIRRPLRHPRRRRYRVQSASRMAAVAPSFGSSRRGGIVYRERLLLVGRHRRHGQGEMDRGRGRRRAGVEVVLLGR